MCHLFPVGIPAGTMHLKFNEWKSQLAFFLSKPAVPAVLPLVINGFLPGTCKLSINF